MADGRFDYVETGSLIFIKENAKDIAIPSEERTLFMYPMNFEEFAWLMDEEPLIIYIRQCFDKKGVFGAGISCQNHAVVPAIYDCGWYAEKLVSI